MRKAALGFGPVQIKTLVSMATNIFHRVIMEKNSVAIFHPILFILAGIDDMHGS